jgi:putative RecB family exonuclease
MPMEQKHISVTQMKMYLRCPLQYKFRYIDLLKIPPVSALTLGKSIHSALEGNYSQKIETKKDLPSEQVIDIFSDSWENNVKETTFEEDEKPGEVKDDGVKLVSIYHKQVSPTIQPKLVEKEFNLAFENVDYTLKGYIDLIDTEDIIIDHKTTKRSMNQEDVSSDLQLSCYAMAYRFLFGGLEKELRFDVMVRNKTPKIQQITTTRTQEDINRFLKVLAYVSKAIKSGIFYPNKNFMCSVCGYVKLCRCW